MSTSSESCRVAGNEQESDIVSTSTEILVRDSTSLPLAQRSLDNTYQWQWDSVSAISINDHT